MKYGIELQELRKYWCGRDGKALKSKDDILGGEEVPAKQALTIVGNCEYHGFFLISAQPLFLIEIT